MVTAVARQKFIGKATVYAPHDILGVMCQFEVLAVRYFQHQFGRSRYAIPNALYVDYRLPHDSYYRRIIQRSDFSILILEDWGHLDPLSPFDRNTTRPTLRLQHCKSDRQWLAKFNVLMGLYLARYQPRVIVDFRTPTPNLFGV